MLRFERLAIREIRHVFWHRSERTAPFASVLNTSDCLALLIDNAAV